MIDVSGLISASFTFHACNLTANVHTDPTICPPNYCTFVRFYASEVLSDVYERQITTLCMFYREKYSHPSVKRWHISYLKDKRSKVRPIFLNNIITYNTIHILYKNKMYVASFLILMYYINVFHLSKNLNNFCSCRCVYVFM
jgi:hypothetical protein